MEIFLKEYFVFEKQKLLGVKLSYNLDKNSCMHVNQDKQPSFVKIF